MKQHEVIIRSIYDPRSTDEKWIAYLEVWADPGKRDMILSVEGVHNVFVNHEENNLRSGTKYQVYIDPRYDMDTLKAQIFEVCTIGIVVRDQDQDENDTEEVMQPWPRKHMKF